MHAGKRSAIGIGIALGLAVVFLVGRETTSLPPTIVPAIQFADAPEFDDTRYRSKTFSLAIADLNGDYRDDILVGAHNQNPFLLISGDGGFTDESQALFPNPRRDDRHGYTLVDLDNDGRLDVTIASGGTDGVGGGWPNLLMRNESEGDELRFVPQPMGEDFALTPGRSRTFIPVASPDGSAVDLYYTTLVRDGYNNRYFRNNNPGSEAPALTADAGHFLSRRINDQGRGVLADFDNDGGVDYLTVERDTARMFWNRDGGHVPIDLVGAARTVLVADFNNDSLLDIFVGRANRQTRSDRMTFASEGMIFTLHKNSEGDVSDATFRSASDSLSFNFNQWVPLDRAERLETTSHIFIGRDRIHPAKRRFTIDKEGAAGEPGLLTEPGIYIWFNAARSTWHMRWVAHPNLDVFKGIVSGGGLEELDRQNFHMAPGQTTRDLLLINEGDGRFTRQDLSVSTHSAITQGATTADFNSDGWLDILGVRHGDQGDEGIAPFLLTNLGVQANGRLGFRESTIPKREQDHLHRSDQVAHGFLDGDNLPDAFITNGFGQIPGTDGVPRLLLNATEGAGDSLLLSLKGEASNRFGLGTKVSLYKENQLLGHRVAGLNINVSQDTGWLHFGLGDAEGPFTVSVKWPDATVTRHEFAEGGRYVLEQAGNALSLSP